MYSKKHDMNRHKKYKYSNREGSIQGLFSTWNKCWHTILYNNQICNDCIFAYQEPVYEFKNSFNSGIKKCWKDEIMKFFKERMYVYHDYIQSAIKYMPTLFICINGLIILTAFMDVFFIRIQICIPAFNVWIKGYKPDRNAYYRYKLCTYLCFDGIHE